MTMVTRRRGLLRFAFPSERHAAPHRKSYAVRASPIAYSCRAVPWDEGKEINSWLWWGHDGSGFSSRRRTQLKIGIGRDGVIWKVGKLGMGGIVNIVRQLGTTLITSSFGRFGLEMILLSGMRTIFIGDRLPASTRDALACYTPPTGLCVTSAAHCCWISRVGTYSPLASVQGSLPPFGSVSVKKQIGGWFTER